MSNGIGGGGAGWADDTGDVIARGSDDMTANQGAR